MLAAITILLVCVLAVFMFVAGLLLGKGKEGLACLLSLIAFVCLFAVTLCITAHLTSFGQSIDASHLEFNQSYFVVPQPDGVVWVQAKGSDIIRAYRFAGQLPPEYFIAVKEKNDGKIIYFNTTPSGEHLVSEPQQEDDTPLDTLE